MATRCKVMCVAVEKRKHYSLNPPFVFTSKFLFVTDGSDENKQFFASTPGGTLETSTAREDHFTPGQYYYVDFTEAQP